MFRNCEKTQKDTCYTVTLTVVSTGTVTRPESSGRDTDYSLWSSQDMSDAAPFPLPRSTRLHPSSSDLLLLRLQSAQLRGIPTGNACGKCSPFTELLSLLRRTFRAAADVSPCAIHSLPCASTSRKGPKANENCACLKAGRDGTCWKQIRLGRNMSQVSKYLCHF